MQGVSFSMSCRGFWLDRGRTYVAVNITGSVCEGETRCSVPHQTGVWGGLAVCPEADNCSDQVIGGLWTPSSGNLQWFYPLSGFSRTQFSFLLGPQPLVGLSGTLLGVPACLLWPPCLFSPGSVPPAWVEIYIESVRIPGAALGTFIVLISICFCVWSSFKS